MATKTTNYNLIKPALTDDADIRVINGNMDVLDTQLKTISDKAGTATNNAYTNVSVNGNYEWKFTKGSGANVSFDTIKNATNATALTGTTGTYKVPTDSIKYSKLEYWYGTLPYKGSTTATTDSAVLKFNHWGSTAWNSAFVPNNNSSIRPYMMYQNGTTGEYSVFKEFAWKDDVDTKLDKAGGTLTGALYTNNSIFKNSNNGVLVLGGSTDATHGGRINLSGEKQTDAGLVKITADNGTNTNVFEVTTGGGGSRYNFNGLTTYMNSSDDYFRLGGNDAYFRLSKNKQLYCNTERINLSKTSLIATDTDLLKVGEGTNAWFAVNKATNKIYYSPSGTETAYSVPYYTLPPVQNGSDWNTENSGYYKTNDGLLVQWGVFVGVGSYNYFKRTLPQPYNNRTYTILITHRHAIWNDTRVNADNRIMADIVDGQTIQICSDNNMAVQWMTIGKAD